MSFLSKICVCNRLASGISADGLNFATRIYIKRKFDSTMSKDKIHQKVGKKEKLMMSQHGT